jgi:acyl-CoA thioester hydrolase
MKFSHSFRVEKSDIDEQGHVNNVAYVRWIQDVAVAHWFHATTAEQQAKVVWVVMRHEVDYKRQAFENEEIAAATWVGEWTAVTCERFTEIRRGADLLVKARTIWCMLDRKTSKPTRISSELKEQFQNGEL